MSGMVGIVGILVIVADVKVSSHDEYVVNVDFVVS